MVAKIARARSRTRWRMTARKPPPSHVGAWAIKC